MAAIREALGPQVDAEARAAGQAVHLEDAVSEVLALADTFAASTAIGKVQAGVTGAEA
jgi:hypothetical protein